MKKKVAIFTISLAGGGAERVITHFLQKLDNELEIHLILLKNEFEFEVPKNIKIHFLKTISDNNFMGIIQIPFLAKQLINYCKTNKITTIISFLNRPNWINCFTKFYSKYFYVIISERTTPSFYYNKKTLNGKLGLLLIKYFYPKADLIIPNSQGVLFDLKEKLNIKNYYKVIYNPVKNIISDTKLNKSNEKPFRFIFVARFQNPKDHLTLIKAFSKLSKFNCELFFLGVGEKMDECKILVHNLKLQDQIRFLGFDKSIDKYLLDADCFVFSSLFEGFPNVIVEAMSCGLPVIATDCSSGPREILAPETNVDKKLVDNIEYAEYGILVPVGNDSIMTDAMKYVLTNSYYTEKLKEKSIKRANHFNEDIFANEFKSIIK